MLLNPLLLVSSVVFATTAAPTTAFFAREVDAATAAASQYDFIIVGGGTSGLTVADRLTENTKVSVLVIEYGPFDKGDESIYVPGQYNPAPYFFPALLSTPQRAMNNAVFFIPAGAVVGGGSAINAMMFTRAGKDNYDAWGTMSESDWNFKSIEPYLKKSENFTHPEVNFAREHNITWDNSVHGFKGPVQCTYSNYDYPGSKSFWNAALRLGFKVAKDPNSGDTIGLRWLLRAMDARNMTRSFSKTAHYDRVSARTNYHILPGHAVSKITFNGSKKATGVEFITLATGDKLSVKAKKEVILAAGATHSPQILQLSGIGPKGLLQKYNISLIEDLPGVGSNLQDHLTLKIGYNFTNNFIPNGDSLNANATYDAEMRTLYETEHRGAYTLVRGTGNNIIILALQHATPNYQSIIKLAQSQDEASLLANGTDPSVIKGFIKQRQITAENYASNSSGVASISWNTGSETTIYMVRPFSRGSVNIGSSDPLATPLIDFGALTDPTDIEVVMAMFRKNREIMKTPEMLALGPTETSPAPGVDDDDDALRELIRAALSPTNAHMCCTAPMMPREIGGVVDKSLKVYGVKNLRVVDMSFWPMNMATAPHSTAYAGAERAADIIKAEYGL